MLRVVVLLLALANLAVFAWTQGWLTWVAGRPGQGEREPDRMARQVQPEAVRVLGGQDARSAMAEAVQKARVAADEAASRAASGPADGGASAPTLAATVPGCLEAGPFSPEQLALADRQLKGLQVPTLRWNTLRSEKGGLFIIYMGRYTDKPTMAKKQDELRRLGQPFMEVADAPPLMPGLELGRFNDRIEANTALEKASQRGVRSARVAMLVAPTPIAALRVDKADPAQAERLLALALEPSSSRFRACAAPTTAAPR